MKIRLLLITFLFIAKLFAQDEVIHDLTPFYQNFHPDWLKAEQRLSETTPFFSNIRKPIGLFLPMAKHNGNLATAFTPGAENQFKLISILIPEDEIGAVWSANMDAVDDVLRTQRNGKNYVRFFIHPSQKRHYLELIAKYIPDHFEWIATPSSSARSLFVMEKFNRAPAMVVKTSMAEAMGGISSRLLLEKQLVRSIKNTEIVKKMYEETQGKLKNSKIGWKFMGEPFAVLPPQKELGGFVIREISQTQDKILLPWYSLISEHEGKKAYWVNKLFEKSRYTNKANFVFDTFAQPITEMYAQLGFENGLTSELHQQNTLISIDPKTLKVENIVIRDLEASDIDHSLRTHQLKKSSVVYKSFEEDAKLFKYAKTTEYMIGSYVEPVRYHNIESIFKYFLSKDELDQVLKRMDAYLVQRFNESFPKFAISHIRQFEDAWKEMKKSITSIEEQKLYDILNGKSTSAQNLAQKASTSDWFYGNYEKWLRNKLKYQKNPSETPSLCSTLLFK